MIKIQTPDGQFQTIVKVDRDGLVAILETVGETSHSIEISPVFTDPCSNVSESEFFLEIDIEPETLKENIKATVKGLMTVLNDLYDQGDTESMGPVFDSLHHFDIHP